MRVRILQDRVGQEGLERAGDIVDIKTRVARELIAQGYAEPVGTNRKRDVAATTENAALDRSGASGKETR